MDPADQSEPPIMSPDPDPGVAKRRSFVHRHVRVISAVGAVLAVATASWVMVFSRDTHSNPTPRPQPADAAERDTPSSAEQERLAEQQATAALIALAEQQATVALIALLSPDSTIDQRIAVAESGTDNRATLENVSDALQRQADALNGQLASFQSTATPPAEGWYIGVRPSDVTVEASGTDVDAAGTRTPWVHLNYVFHGGGHEGRSEDRPEVAFTFPETSSAHVVEVGGAWVVSQLSYCPGPGPRDHEEHHEIGAAGALFHNDFIAPCGVTQLAADIYRALSAPLEGVYLSVGAEHTYARVGAIFGVTDAQHTRAHDLGYADTLPGDDPLVRARQPLIGPGYPDSIDLDPTGTFATVTFTMSYLGDGTGPQSAASYETVQRTARLQFVERGWLLTEDSFCQPDFFPVPSWYTGGAIPPCGPPG